MLLIVRKYRCDAFCVFGVFQRFRGFGLAPERFEAVPQVGQAAVNHVHGDEHGDQRVGPVENLEPRRKLVRRVGFRKGSRGDDPR